MVIGGRVPPLLVKISRAPKERRCMVSLHRLLYEWQSAIGLNPTEGKSEPPTSSARTTLSSHTPGTWLSARVRSRVPAGASDWSSVIQIMVV